MSYCPFVNKLVPKNRFKLTLVVLAILLLVTIQANTDIDFAPRSVVFQRAKMDRMKMMIDMNSAQVGQVHDESTDNSLPYIWQ